MFRAQNTDLDIFGLMKKLSTFEKKIKIVNCNNIIFFAGTQITLVLKEEAYDYLEQDTVKDLIKKYSQFINFSIYMWSSKTEMVDEPIDDEDEEKPEVRRFDKISFNIQRFPR